MNRGNGVVSMWAAVFLGSVLWAHGALAFCPPCQQVTAWKEGTFPNQTVHYKVYDPKKDAYVEGSTSESAELYDLYFPQGLVFWGARISSHGALYCRVYDPGRAAWRGDEWIAADSYLSVPKGGDGVVTWLGSGSPGEVNCFFRTYDPGPGVWKGGEMFSDYPDPVTLITHDGVVAWYLRTLSAPYSAHILFAIYDPSRSSWRTDYAIIPQESGVPWPSLSIYDGTIHYGDYRFGYDAASGTWISGADTQPLSWFVAQPTVGKAPLWVWFTDMTIGPLSWARSWTFGDGGSSSLVSPHHTYGNKGKFTVTEQVTAPWTTSSFSQEITVRGADLSGGLDLLLLQ